MPHPLSPSGVAAIQTENAAQQADNAIGQTADQCPQQRIQRVGRARTVVRYRGAAGVIGDSQAAMVDVDNRVLRLLKSLMVTPDCVLLALML